MAKAAPTKNRFGAVVDKRSAPSTAATAERLSKYTILLSHRVSTDLDEDLLALRRATGRRVDKSDVLRSLLGLLHTHPKLFDQVAKEIAAQER